MIIQKEKAEEALKEIIDIVVLICVPAMVLLVLLLINYEIVLKMEIVKNIYGQIICLYGISILFSLCYIPVRLTSSSFRDIGLCLNQKAYQNFIAIIGMFTLITIFIYENSLDILEGAYVLQFIFVGIGEEVFFRAILYNKLKHLCKSEMISILIVAVIFGYLFHSDGGIVALLFIRMPLSIAFSLIYKKTGSLSIPIILHAIYDILV